MTNTLRSKHNVAALLYPGQALFELSIVTEIMGTPRPELGVDWYAFASCSVESGPLPASGGLSITAERGLDALDAAGTIIIPGWSRDSTDVSSELREKMFAAYHDGARIISLCSGAFLLAELGLLDGRKATTHWAFSDDLAKQYPKVHVTPDVLYVDDAPLYTAAGSSAGIDLLLHIVREDYDTETANAVARRLVTQPVRTGGQQQFIPAPVPSVREERISALIEAVRAQPNKAWRVDDMAEFCAMSTRTFARKFNTLTGMSPGHWLLLTRLGTVKNLLETSGAPITAIAAISGMGAPENLSRQFQKWVGIPPGEYRKRFSNAGLS